VAQSMETRQKISPILIAIWIAKKEGALLGDEIYKAYKGGDGLIEWGLHPPPIHIALSWPEIVGHKYFRPSRNTFALVHSIILCWNPKVLFQSLYSLIETSTWWGTSCVLLRFQSLYSLIETDLFRFLGCCRQHFLQTRFPPTLSPQYLCFLQA